MSNVSVDFVRDEMMRDVFPPLLDRARGRWWGVRCLCDLSLCRSDSRELRALHFGMIDARGGRGERKNRLR